MQDLREKGKNASLSLNYLQFLVLITPDRDAQSLPFIVIFSWRAGNRNLEQVQVVESRPQDIEHHSPDCSARKQ